VELINGAERIRGQLAALGTVLAGDPRPESRPQPEEAHKDVRDAAQALDKKLLALEEELFQVRVTGRGQDLLRHPVKLAEQLLYLVTQVTGGDFAPTASQREVHQLLHEQATTLEARYDGLVATELAQFNALLAERKLAGIVARP
jgi:hypothetical protein